MTADLVALSETLFEEATAHDERRLLVLAGDRSRGYDSLEAVLEALPVGITATTLVGPDDRLRCEHRRQANAGELLGTTRTVVALDAHGGLRPNALGSVVGAVDGGGLLVLLTPALEDWPDHHGEFDESLAVPPFSIADVTGRFRGRLVDTLREHRGIAIVDVDAGTVGSTGVTNPPPRWTTHSNGPTDSEQAIGARPVLERFPLDVADACLSGDQLEAVGAFESLVAADDEGGKRAVVLEADRGRGKSSAAGLAAGALAADGADVLVTAPGWRNAREVFERTRELCETLEATTIDRDRRLETTAGGCVRFLEAAAAIEELETADIVIVDEAAALPVPRLESLLSADAVAFATTIHGYEGAGRGFSVRFRDRLAESDHAVTDCTLTEPIRYAGGDPIEVWAFRALLLDARPAVDSLVAGATPDSVTYRRLEPDDLLADERLLRELFGLLVLAHYRTEPNDLARLLDAPNLETRALVQDGHVVSVALLAREGRLSSETRAMMYEGGRVRGNMLPDVLASQLRDEDAGEPAGVRIVRIATHHAVRSRGLGSTLLERIRREFTAADAIDWLGTGFGATPELLAFWRENGYRTVHVSTTRNDASGEYSALMLSPTSEAGRELSDRHAEQFVRRVPSQCLDALSDLEADVAREALRSVGGDVTPGIDLTDYEWRVVAGAAYGPGLFEVAPRPFRRLAVRYFLDDPDEIRLCDREERLLVLRALQGRDPSAVADRLGYQSRGQCMRALGEAFRPLVDRYGTKTALAVRDRFDRTGSSEN
ncbi:tRNA(Met) cytidine acetyltransferase [Natrarchaeobius halalkaliphilus]|uniref:tRNA(Met) cytidine acetyltransferase TmcA n=1 Tax=Natrarchaeobius halalkaliphilus TaxID=1679091 RepID=A0A3N6M797_9EURY|nr:tRNA(Met) cytidine acetyltransferase TmcA [Natrarchaeobius halalkaliphilus]RQG91211.1 tRNA(Met) cytidine acetyltransferase [Natrarchaeobius halalkaliphilus]